MSRPRAKGEEGERDKRCKGDAQLETQGEARGMKWASGRRRRILALSCRGDGDARHDTTIHFAPTTPIYMYVCRYICSIYMKYVCVYTYIYLVHAYHMYASIYAYNARKMGGIARAATTRRNTFTYRHEKANTQTDRTHDTSDRGGARQSWNSP